MTNRILLVFAHPDDETFTCGGTVAHYARNHDCTIHLLCATRGEAGKTGNPPQCRPEELADVREKELKEAASVLGIDHVELLGYHDGHLSEVPLQQLSAYIIQYLYRFQPDVVITFPPHGISRHRDHQAIQKATYEAVKQVETERFMKLYYTILPDSMKHELHRSVQTDPDDLIDVRINVEKYHDIVASALEKHRTQNMSVNAVFPGVLEGDHRALRKNNYFHLAWSNHPKTAQAEGQPLFDLF